MGWNGASTCCSDLAVISTGARYISRVVLLMAIQRSDRSEGSFLGLSVRGDKVKISKCGVHMWMCFDFSAKVSFLMKKDLTHHPGFAKTC